MRLIWGTRLVGEADAMKSRDVGAGSLHANVLRACMSIGCVCKVVLVVGT